MRVKRTREENIAKFAANYEKEASGLQLVRETIAHDKRLCLRKCAEGARADFCVHLPHQEQRALGVQLKTAHTVQTKNVGGASHVQFGKTSGYSGLQILFIDFTSTPPRTWLVAGDLVKENSVYIGYASHRPSKWRAREIPTTEIAAALHTALMTGADLESVDVLTTPLSKNRQQEHRAFKWLQQRLPMEFEEPEVEHRSWDWSVEGAKWQAKLAHHDPAQDCFRVSLSKGAGLVGGKLRRTQYEDGDFDYLAIQLPFWDEQLAATPPHFYLIPMSCLLERGLAGRQTTNGMIKLRPHRAFGFGSWPSEFMVDLRDPWVAVEQVQGIMSIGMDTEDM